MRRNLATIALLLAVPVFAERRVAIIIDTSGSMLANDRPRYTVQLGQIIGDLLSDADRLTVVRLPQSEANCGEGPDWRLSITLRRGDRAGFQSGLNGLIQYSGDNYFAAPIRTALDALGKDPNVQRLLLMIADSGGLGNCDKELTVDLMRLHQTGALIAAINIGSSLGAFETNPAFDVRTPATDSEKLVRSVAEVYQRFLGARHVQTGRIENGQIQTRVDPFARSAFLVIAADGPVGNVQTVGSHPAVVALDLNHLGGGHTEGLDHVDRGYRIVKMDHPGAGNWTFSVSGSTANAGWMFVEDLAVGMRIVSGAQAPDKIPATIDVELFDEQNGKAITDPDLLRGLSVSADIDGQRVNFTTDPSRPGTLTGTITFHSPGKHQFLVNLISDTLQRSYTMETEVLQVSWKLQPLTPPRVYYGSPTNAKVKLDRIGAAGFRPPAAIELDAAGVHVTLKDDGTNGDDRPGDGIYSGPWNPSAIGTQTLNYTGGNNILSASQQVEALGQIEFKSGACALGVLHGNSEGRAALDLSASHVSGWIGVELRSPFHAAGMALEIDTGSGWQTIGDKPVSLRVDERSSRAWPVRLRVGDCANALPQEREFEIRVPDVTGTPRQFRVPFQVQVIPDSWLHCWWPVLAMIGAALLGLFIFHGYWSPSRFTARAGVMLSPEEDVDGEGFFHPIRGQPGSRPGFYHDATVFVNKDFRISGKPSNAVVKLRAEGEQIRVAPYNGETVWRKTSDGDWEQIPAEETTTRPGITYKNDGGTIFFELRVR